MRTTFGVVFEHSVKPFLFIICDFSIFFFFVLLPYSNEKIEDHYTYRLHLLEDCVFSSVERKFPLFILGGDLEPLPIKIEKNL